MSLIAYCLWLTAYSLSLIASSRELQRGYLRLRSYWPLVPDGFAIIAGVAGAQALSRFGINGNALAVAPVAVGLDLVSARFKRLDGIGREAATFEVELVRHPLIVKSRRVNCLL